MAGGNLSNVTVSFSGDQGDFKVNAYSAHAGIAALPSEQPGISAIGSVEANISFQVDLNDQSNPDLFGSLKKLFDLCNRATKAKIVSIKMEFWKDQSQSDTHVTLSFDGWVTSWHIASGSGANHVLAVSVMPKLDPTHFMKVDLSN
jgi:hypothetical protein